ncbi:MAG: STAS domain-containing protein [Desulfobacterales bacterium]|nr:STAS domain-containing protein [Desulfobacterales bacterium]
MFDVIRDGSRVIFNPGQDVVASVVPNLKKHLHSLLQEGIRELVIDFADVEMIDSVGLGILISAHNSLNNCGGKLKIVNVSKDILTLLKAMRLDKHFEVKEKERSL